MYRTASIYLNTLNA